MLRYHHHIIILTSAIFFALSQTTLPITNFPIYHKLGIDDLLDDENASCVAADQLREKHSIDRQKKKHKNWTFIIYMSADNDLRGFAARNIKQMATIGSNEHINIVVQLDIRISGERKITRRYYIANGRILHANADDPESQQMDSGAPETLISCCKWAIQNYPAEHTALIFWNHGTGILDPERGRIINATELFAFNPINNKFELDRSIGFFDFVNAINREEEQRGICWDDTTGNYLTNQALDYALNTIKREYLEGKNFSIIGFDACLMAMLEVGNIMKKYAEVMVSSQEVELGTGWNYSLVLAPFEKRSLDVQEFSKHIIQAYQHAYHQITNDYTLSAINLSLLEELETNLHQVSGILIECLRTQKNGSVKRAIRVSRDKFVCTHFDEPSYIDQHHFYTNLLANIAQFDIKRVHADAFLNELRQLLHEGCSLIQKIAFANTTGNNLSKACGISIYFPERKIHASYRKTTFATKNLWTDFLTTYIAA